MRADLEQRIHLYQDDAFTELSEPPDRYLIYQHVQHRVDRTVLDVAGPLTQAMLSDGGMGHLRPEDLDDFL